MNSRQDSIAIYNRHQQNIELVIEPWGDILPFPANAGYYLTGVGEISFAEDRIIAYTGGSDISAFLDQYEIYSSKIYSSDNSKAYPAVPDGTTVEEFITTVLEAKRSRQTLIQSISVIPSKIAAAAKHANGKPQSTGHWSLNMEISHLAHVEVVIWQARLKQMAAEENPHWQWTEPPLESWWPLFESQSLEQLLATFAARRRETVDHLRGLTDGDWKRIGTHAIFGQMDVAGLCARILEHDEEHLEELRKRGE